MKFEKFDLAPEIIENLNDIGFFRTTDIQFKAMPAIIKGEDVLAIAQTGTGKTAAFAIPIINAIHLSKSSKRNMGLRCLVIVPTRELAKQIGKVFSQISKHTRANSFAIYGGIEQDPQIAQLKGGIDILIATPGRMFDLISQKHIDTRSVDILVLDEADHMLDLGFIEDIENIKRILKQQHQTLFFSATINPTIKKLAYSQVKQGALRIQVSPQNLVSKNVQHLITKVDMDDKRHLLVNFFQINKDAKVIVFVRTQVRAERVLAHLIKNDISAVNLHGGMDQAAREKSLEAFRESKCGALIATDVSARGIDLPGVTHVINYDVPDEPENYVHRVGRTGRAFAKGDAITFCSPEESEKLKAVEAFIETEIAEFKVDKSLKKAMPTDEDIEKLDVADILAMEEQKYVSKRKKKKKH